MLPITPPRTPPLAAIVAAAADVFAVAGYHRTQMTDIALAVGVAPGTLYRYIQSKEQLFALALIYGVGDDAMAWCARRSWQRDVAGFLEERVHDWFDLTQLRARFGTGNDDYSLDDVLTALYDQIERQRYAIRILDRSAKDWPELSLVYVTRVRDPAITLLTQALATLQSQGVVRDLPDIAASARFVLETVAWFAMHRVFSPGPAAMADDVARRVCLDHVSTSLVSRE